MRYQARKAALGKAYLNFQFWSSSYKLIRFCTLVFTSCKLLISFLFSLIKLFFTINCLMPNTFHMLHNAFLINTRCISYTASVPCLSTNFIWLKGNNYKVQNMLSITKCYSRGHVIEVLTSVKVHCQHKIYICEYNKVILLFYLSILPNTCCTLQL